MTTETKPPKVSVAWCRGCHHYLYKDSIGDHCPDCEQRLVKKVGYICALCANLSIHWSVKSLEECTHDN